MARISEDRKKEIRHNILEEAGKSFYEKGFEKTSTKEIAKAVGIAEGTLFNYFDVKTDIFLEALAHKIDMNEPDVLPDDVREGSVADILTEYLEKLYNPILVLPKFLVVEVITVLTKIGKKGFVKIRKLANIDFKYMENTRVLIEMIQSEGRLVADLDCKTMAETIYGILFFEVSLYAYYGDMTRERLKENIREKVEFICKGYLV